MSADSHLGRGKPATFNLVTAEDKADRGRGEKTTSGNGQAWTSPSPREQWKTERNGGNWL